MIAERKIKKGVKARPHDIKQVIDIFKPQLIELHASSEDLSESIEGEYFDTQLAVHLPEYDGTKLMDLSSLNEIDRLKAVTFFNRAISQARKWGEQFKGTPKVIAHPGGWSDQPRPKDCRHNNS